jgi:hypothetical protein
MLVLLLLFGEALELALASVPCPRLKLSGKEEMREEILRAARRRLPSEFVFVFVLMFAFASELALELGDDM